MKLAVGTLVSQIVERTEIDAHLEEIAENLTAKHLFFTISIATNDRTPEIFSTALIVKRIWLSAVWYKTKFGSQNLATKFGNHL